MYVRSVLAVVVLLSCMTPLIASAQRDSPQSAEVDTLTRVRVLQRAMSPRRITGRLVYADSLLITVEQERTRNRVVFPLPVVERLERRQGFITLGERTWRGAKRGFLVGAAISATLLAIGAISDAQDPCTDCWITATGGAVIVSVPLLASSTTVGALAGAAGPRERWVPVPLPVRLRSEADDL